MMYRICLFYISSIPLIYLHHKPSDPVQERLKEKELGMSMKARAGAGS